MTYISRKTRLLVPHFVDECDPGYLYYMTKKRSDGRLKRHSSCDDLRAWVDDEYLNYQYLLELMSNGEERPFSGLMGRFIPIEAILDVLSGKYAEGGDSLEEWEREEGARVAGLRPKPEFNDSGVCETTDDLLRLADAAVTKLETIRGILYPESSEDVSRPSDVSSGKEANISKECTHMSTSISNNIDMEEYMINYNSTLTKIARLRQKLHSIQERRDDLNAKIQLSCQTKCQSSSHMTVTELYNREEHSNAKRLQKKIEKLIAEKGQVLQEMCSSLKYLSELKRNVDAGNRGRKCPCTCSKIEGYRNSGRLRPQQKEEHSSLRHSKTSNSNSFQNGKEHYISQCPLNETMSINRDDSRGSSDATFISVETIPICESQRTYNVRKGSILDRKFKSETTVTEVEQTLRNYEQRLKDLASLESEIEELKKGAAMAEYFKKRWVRSMVRGRSQKTQGEEMRKELEELQKENCELKKMVQTLASESEKEHSEMQRLRCKAMKIAGMQEEMTRLKDQISGYQLSCVNQNECIAGLEKTVREQRDEIDRLMAHMAKLCRMTEKLREGKRPNKKSVPRSRSYGPERQNSAPGDQRSIPAEPEDEIRNTPCCGCNRNYYNTEQLNRPRSECGKRISDRCSELLPHQQIYRNQSRYN